MQQEDEKPSFFKKCGWQQHSQINPLYTSENFSTRVQLFVRLLFHWLRICQFQIFASSTPLQLFIFSAETSLWMLASFIRNVFLLVHNMLGWLMCYLFSLDYGIHAPHLGWQINFNNRGFYPSPTQFWHVMTTWASSCRCFTEVVWRSRILLGFVLFCFNVPV